MAEELLVIDVTWRSCWQTDYADASVDDANETADDADDDEVAVDYADDAVDGCCGSQP